VKAERVLRFFERLADEIEALSEPLETRAYRAGLRSGRVLSIMRRYKRWWLAEFERGLHG